MRICFQMSGNPRQSGILHFVHHPRFCRYIGYSLEVCLIFSRLYHFQVVERGAIFICDRETGAQQFKGLVTWAKSIADFSDGKNCFFHLSGMIADHRGNLGRVAKIETLPVLQICRRSSKTIGDIYDFEFSLVGKIWDGRETIKSRTVWDFPDIWKPGLLNALNMVS